MITKEQAVEQLKQCYDPEIPINIVDLGLIYGIDIHGDIVKIQMTLTSRGCPMSGYLADIVKSKIEELDGVKKADVEIVWDPPWTPDRIAQSAKDSLGL